MRVLDREQGPSQTPEAVSEERVHSEELSLSDFIDPLLNSWAWIAIMALFGAGVAFGLASLRRPIYEATAVVRVASDQIDPVRAENLRRLLENRTIASEMIREFGITSEPAWRFRTGSNPPAADAFLVNHMSIEPVPGTNLLRVKVRLGHADLAAKMANEWVGRGNALSRRISQQEDTDARENIKTRLDQADKRLATLQTDLLSLKQKSPGDATLLEVQTAIEYERVFLTYVDLSTKYEDARIRAATSTAQLQIVDPAVPPNAPLSPRVSVITQLGGVLGLLVGCLVVLGRHFLVRHRIR